MQSTVEDEIHALSIEAFRWQAEGHVDQLADLFDDDPVLVHLNEPMRPRRFVYDRIDLSEASVHGETAVPVGKATFVKNDQWKLVNLHTCSTGS